MLSNIPKRWFWIAGIMLAIGVSFLIFPPYRAYCQRYDANDYGCAGYHIQHVLIGWVDRHGGAVTALATIAIAWFTFSLRQSTDALRIATSNAEKSRAAETRILQRAYLTVAPIGVHPYISLDGRLSCDVRIDNAGNLPATHVRWLMDRDFSSDGTRSQFALPVKEWSGGSNVIPPKGRMRKGARPLQQQEIYDFIDSSKGKDRWFYVWGQVRYHDGFQDDRWIDFCHRFFVADDGAGSGHVANRTGRQHEYGNATDES